MAVEERYRLFRNFMSNKLYNWACILMNILQAKKIQNTNSLNIDDDEDDDDGP